MSSRSDVVTIDEDGPLLLIGVNRPEAYNLWNLDVIQTVSRAYRRLGTPRTFASAWSTVTDECSPPASTSCRWPHC